MAQRLRSRRGQSIVEFSLAIPALLLLFFGIFEFGRYYWTRVTLRHVVREAARFAVTGNVLPDSAGDPLDRPTSIQQLILGSNGAFGLRITPGQISLTPADGGGPGSIVQVAVDYPYTPVVPLVASAFPGGQVMIRVSTVMRNESF